MQTLLEIDKSHFVSIGGPGYVAIGGAALLSAFGWYAVGTWMDASDPGLKFILAILRTVFTLFPALVAFMVASKRQKEVQRRMALKLDVLKNLMTDYQRLQSVDHELKTMDRLSKVARNAVMNTAASSQELFGAIEAVVDKPSKDLLLERFRHHTSSVVTILSAVNEQLSESGRAISENITADDQINIVERANKNTESGLELAQKMIETRGIGDGMRQLKTSIEQAQSLQAQLAFTVHTLEAPRTIDSQAGDHNAPN